MKWVGNTTLLGFEGSQPMMTMLLDGKLEAAMLWQKQSQRSSGAGAF
jgi:hypothetical protein